MELTERWPALPNAFVRETARWSAMAGQELGVERWLSAFAEPKPKRQAAMTAPVMKQAVQRVHDAVAREGGGAGNRLGGACGREAAAFMFPPEGVAPMPDHQVRCALRMRCGFRDVTEHGCTKCANVDHAGAACGRECGRDYGEHAVRCLKGGGANQRHNGVRNAVGGWLKELGFRVELELEVPEWQGDNGEAARLDVCYWAGGRTQYVDTTVVTSGTKTPGALVVLERRERTKHRKYPGPSMIPFVADARGRWGVEAKAWARGICKGLPADQKGEQWAKLQWVVARALQEGVAEQVYSCGAIPAPVLPCL